MKNLTLENLTKVCGGVYFGPSDKLEQEVSSITTDSRKAEAGTYAWKSLPGRCWMHT